MKENQMKNLDNSGFNMHGNPTTNLANDSISELEKCSKQYEDLFNEYKKLIVEYGKSIDTNVEILELLDKHVDRRKLQNRIARVMIKLEKSSLEWDVEASHTKEQFVRYEQKIILHHKLVAKLLKTCLLL